MKKIVSPILVAFLVCPMLSILALARGKNEKVTFSRDMVVNGTVVKKGTYRLKLDDQSKELSIMDGKTTLVKTAVRLENSKRRPSSTEIIFNEKDNTNVLKSITFVGDSDTIILAEGGRETAAPNN